MQRSYNVLRMVIIAFCSLSCCIYVAYSWRWPLVHDAQVMHYVSFLIDHGFAPYRQIGDMNMPGAYLVEGWALKIFGASDFGWRIYDFTLGGILILAMCFIARTSDWVAGLVAGTVFAVLHGGDLAAVAGQRDQVMTVCLCAGYAFCFESLRRRRPWLMFGFGATAGLAAAVKPTLVLFAPLLLLFAVIRIRRQKTKSSIYVFYAFAGMASISALVISFLLVHSSFQYFWYDLFHVLPHYAGLDASSFRELLAFALQKPLVLYFVLAAAVAFATRIWGDGETNLLLIGVGLGLFNYFAQRKGYSYHRYSTMAFTLLWASIVLFRASKNRNEFLRYGTLTIVLLLLVDVVPRTLRFLKTQKNFDCFTEYLESDLRAMGTASLQHNVQCMDIVDGCMTALFHLGIVQSTGATGDLLLFIPQPSPVVEESRRHFYDEIQSNPPKVIVLTNVVFRGARGFNKLSTWPLFANWLNKNYTLSTERIFPTNGTPLSMIGEETGQVAYRLYLKR